MDLVKQVNYSKAALIFPKAMMETASGSGCAVIPDVFRSVYISKETFAEGLFASLFSHNIHPIHRKAAEYYFRSDLEMGLLWGVMNLVKAHINEVVNGMHYGIKAMECEALLNGQEPELEEPWDPFTITQLCSFFKLLIYGLTGSLGVLMFEHIQYKTGQRIKTFRNRVIIL